jgi:hypothetical protein
MIKPMAFFKVMTTRRVPIWRILASLLTFLFLVPVVLSLAACVKTPADVTAAAGQAFILEPGQKAIVSDVAIEIRFVKVVGDSRCPKGAECIWAGEVTSQIEIKYQGQKQDLVLKQSGSSEGEDFFADFKITFDVQPYPELEKQINDKDYRLHMTWTKESALSGGILATFQVVGEQYSFFVTNKQTIDQIYALQRGESNANIPVGRVVRGAVSYNKPWSWHIDPEEVSMAEMTAEISDGLPSYVEENLDYWVDTVKYFSPWSAMLVDIKDYR